MNAWVDALAAGEPRAVQGAHRMLKRMAVAASVYDEGAPLTPKELEALTGMADLAGVKQVATHMGVEYSTVASHLKSVHRKLGVHSNAQAVARALRAGIIT